MSDEKEFKVPARAKDVIVFSGEEASLAYSFDKDELLGKKPPVPTPCNYCGKETLKRCSKCFIIYACSKKCFKKMWKQHKPLCQKVQMHRHEESLQEEAADDIRMLWWQNPQTNSKLFPAYTKHTLYQLGEEPYLSMIKKNRKIFLEWLLRNAKTWNKKIIFNADNRIHSVDDYAKISIEAMTSNKLFFLTFDLRKPWCIYHANHEAALYKKNQFRGELSYMHLGFWVLVGDSHAYASGFSDQLKYKISVQNVLKTCDTKEAQQCQQCAKFVDMTSIPCSRCMTAICSSCEKEATTFHDDGTSTFKCPKCCKDITNKHPTSFYVDGESNNGETYSKSEIEYRNLLLLNNYEQVVGKPPKLHRTIREIITLLLEVVKNKVSQDQCEEIEASVKHMLSNKEQREIAVTNAIESSAVQNLILQTKKTSSKSGAYHLMDDTSCEYGQPIPGTKLVWGWNYNCEEPQLLFAENYDNVEKVQLAAEDFKFVSENVGPQEFRKMMGLASCGDAKQFKKWDMPSKQRDTSSEDFLTGVKANIKQLLKKHMKLDEEGVSDCDDVKTGASPFFNTPMERLAVEHIRKWPPMSQDLMDFLKEFQDHVYCSSTLERHHQHNPKATTYLLLHLLSETKRIVVDHFNLTEGQGRSLAVDIRNSAYLGFPPSKWNLHEHCVVVNFKLWIDTTSFPETCEIDKKLCILDIDMTESGRILKLFACFASDD